MSTKSCFRTAAMATAALGLLLSTVPLDLRAEEPKAGGTLIWSLASTPRHLNPAVQSGIATGQPGAQLFAAPLRYDENWNPEPYLAKSWDISDDGLTVTLKLVEGATFHDGMPITSKDFAFSIKTVQENHPFKTMFAPVETVETPDAATVVLKLSKPHPALLLAMSSQLLSIIPEHIYGDGQDPKTHPRNSEDVVGSGPFKFVEFERDQHIVLERNENYFMENQPYLDKIVMRIVKDDSARAIALENGEIHFSAFESVPHILNRLKKADNLVATDQGYAAIGPITWLAFNTAKAPLNDKRVRQAIAYAVDRDFLLKAIQLGTSAPATGPIINSSPLAELDVETYDLDLDKANALLDEAGFPKQDDGFRFPLTIDFGWAAVKPMAEYLKPQLKKIGINVTVRPSPDFPTWSNRISTWDYDMTWDTVFNWGDPVIGVHRTYISDNIKKGVIWSNTQSYKNAEVDQLLEAAGRETNPEERKILYAKFQKIVTDELPVYWTHTVPYHSVYNKSLGNPPTTIWGTSSPLDRVYWKADPVK